MFKWIWPQFQMSAKSWRLRSSHPTNETFVSVYMSSDLSRKWARSRDGEVDSKGLNDVPIVFEIQGMVKSSFHESMIVG